MYEAKEIQEGPSAIGRPKLKLESDYVANVHEIVLESNKFDNYLTSESIAAELYRTHSHSIDPQTFSNHLHQMSFYYDVGTRLNAPNIAKYCHQYVQSDSVILLTAGEITSPRLQKFFSTNRIAILATPAA
ncbi:hypothetical protein BJV82DRAFT_663496 [Fennellomyces sp. T-0311]|nr:hypothetical protein BJV82DRAFT_663496 [Fennellomyces sp. T-0311]